MFERKAARARTVLSADPTIRKGKVNFKLRCKRHRDRRLDGGLAEAK